MGVLGADDVTFYVPPSATAPAPSDDGQAGEGHGAV
jgi:hypothetical protein